jgi:[ribosomal protein S5]-alanine N-acetyltransferase
MYMINREIIDALNITLNSDRLCLIPIKADHAQLLFTAMQDPSIYTWISSVPPTNVIELEKWWLELADRLLTTHDVLYLNWAVQRKSDGVWLGKMDVDIDSNNIAINTGYIFFPPFWGQGYASEAACLLAEHLAQTGIIEQRAFVTFGNIASTKVLERAGFVRARIIKDNDTLRGVLVDDIEYIRRR